MPHIPSKSRCLSLLLIAALTAISAACQRHPKSPKPGIPTVKTSYALELSNLNAMAEGGQRMLKQHPNDLYIAQDVVSTFLERARLTGNYADYGLASNALAEASQIGGKLLYPCLLAAKLNYTQHRLKQAEEELGHCPSITDGDAIAAMHADIAFYSGRYAEAEAIYRSALNDKPSVSGYTRMAAVRRYTGAPGEAMALLVAAEQINYTEEPVLKAWLKLQRGLVAYDQGDLSLASALFYAANQALPGWWLADEQLAEIKVLMGEPDEARKLYEGVIARSGLPEHMDELARLLRNGSDPASANVWIQKAEAIYRERLKTYPEASAGHAVDHFLQFGTPAEALALARRNVELRPYGDAKIALAEALFRAGQAGEAATTIAEVEASGWNTAKLHAIAAQIYAGMGQSAKADAERQTALGLNRYAMRLFPLPQSVQPELLSLLQ